ncbi:MAG: hypothetical protein QM737_18255 [Ferruginibacter sp.]
MTDKTPESTATRPECDITKTHVMVELFRIPQEQRDDAWHQKFYANVETASYACGDPQVFVAPDDFPYFILKTPEPNQPFESFCIRNLKDDFLLENGIGVALNPTETSVEWVFSYGDIVNLHINKQFFSKPNEAELQHVGTMLKGEQILIAQPSESYLPKQARQVLRSFLISIGIAEPKIMMVCRRVEGTIIQELAFNVYADDFPSAEIFNYRMQQITWFLPRHYIIVSFPRQSGYENDLADL